tara:strand:+ start:672 stop:1154 length:483 start_codon:yes stop_codon:yes gene_type:complete
MNTLLGPTNFLNEENKKDTSDGKTGQDEQDKTDEAQEIKAQEIKALDTKPYLTNHELHTINNIKKQNIIRGKKTILDETLGEIVDKCINFLTYSFDGYSKKFMEAETIVEEYEDKSWYGSLKTHSIAMLLFIRDDDNILYIGILLIFFSIIIYFINITTS